MSRSEESRRRAAIRVKIAHARKMLRELAKTKREALKQIKQECRAARVDIRARVKVWRQMQAQLLKAAERDAKHHARAKCDRAKHDAMMSAKTTAEGLRQALAIENAHLAEQKNQQKAVNPRRRAGGHRAAEHYAEALDEIAYNLPERFKAVFEIKKNERAIQNTIRKAQRPGSMWSPSEAVLHYLEEHPEATWQVDRGYFDDADRMWRDQLKAHQEQAKAKAPKLTAAQKKAIKALKRSRGVKEIAKAMAAGWVDQLSGWRDDAAAQWTPTERDAWATVISYAQSVREHLDPVPF